MSEDSVEPRGSVRSFRRRQSVVLGCGVLWGLLVAFLWVGSVQAQESVEVDAHISADSVRIGERFTVFLAAEHAIDSEVIFPNAEDEESRLFGDVRVIRRGPVQERRVASGRRVDSVAYEVTTFALDSARVPPLPLRVVAGADTTRVNSSARIVPVISVVDEDAKGLRDPAALASFPQPLWSWIVLGLVVAALLAGLAYVWWRRQQDDPEPVAQVMETEQTRSPYEVATSELRRLQRQEVTEPEAVKAFYVDLTDILRTYLSQELGVAALERTTPELVRALEQRSDVSAEAVRRIQAVLERADVVKFAGTRPLQEENRQALREARAALAAVRTPPRSSARTRAEEAPSPA